MFEPSLEALLVELEQLGRENDQRVSERRYQLLNLERPTAELIWLLLQSTRRRRVRTRLHFPPVLYFPALSARDFPC